MNGMELCGLFVFVWVGVVIILMGLLNLVQYLFGGK